MTVIAVIVAIVTIIGVVTAPFTIAGLLGAISAGAGAASSVLGALGYRKAAMIFGLIAMATGFGSLIAAKIAAPDLSSATTLEEIGDAFEKLEALRRAKLAAWSGIFNGVGAVANNLQDKDKRRRRREPGEGSIFIQQLPPTWTDLMRERWRRTDKQHRREKAIRECMKGLGNSRVGAAGRARADTTGVSLVWAGTTGGAMRGPAGAMVGLTLASVKAVTIDEIYHRNKTIPDARAEQPGDRLYCDKQVSEAGF